MIINKKNYDYLQELLTNGINYILVKFNISNTKNVSAELIALMQLDEEYLEYIRKDLYIVIYDRNIVEANQKNYFEHLKNLLKKINNLNKFELKKIIVMLTTHYPTYQDFIDNKNQIIEHILLIRQTSLEAQKKIETLQKKLLKLINFAHIRNDEKELYAFESEKVKIHLENKKAQTINEKFEIKEKFLQSQEYKTAYNAEYSRLAIKNYTIYLRDTRMLFLLDRFYKDGELAFTNNKMFDDKKQELTEIAYKHLYKNNYEALLSQSSPSKLKLQDASKIYSQLEREFNSINLYRLEHTYSMGVEVRETFSRLYDEIGKHTLNTLDITNETAIYFSDLYQKTLYNEELSSMLDGHNQTIQKKFTKTMDKLIELGITDNDWQEKAAELDIEIPDDTFMEESELEYLDTDGYEERENFENFIKDNKLKDVATKNMSNSSNQATQNEPINKTSSNSKIKTPQNQQTIQCTCSRSKLSDIDDINCTYYMENQYSFSDEELLELAQEAECQIITSDLLKSDNEKIKIKLLINNDVKESDKIKIIKEDRDIYIQEIIKNMGFFENDFLISLLNDMYDFSNEIADMLLELDNNTLLIKLLPTQIYNEYMFERLSSSNNLEILKAVAQNEDISEEVFLNLLDSDNEKVIELLSEYHPEYYEQYCSNYQ